MAARTGDPDAAVRLPGGSCSSPASASSGSTGRCSCSASSRCSTSRSAWTPTNPPDSVIKWLEQDRYYRWCTYLYLPIQYAGLVFACWLWSHGNLSTLDSIGLALTVAMVSGIAINTAHELGHKRASLERWLSKVALAQSGYGHFFIEHNRGHHVRVATPEDPAQRPPRRELLRVPAAHRRRQPALRVGAGAHAPAPRWQVARGARATTSSTRGR